MFDPSKYKMTESADFEVVDASGDVIYLDDEQTKPWTIRVASPGTKKATKAAFEYKQSVSADLISQSKGRKTTSSDQVEIKRRADFLMKITEGTNAGDLIYNDKTGLDALREIYLDTFMDHVTSGVDKFHHDQGNFSADSAKTSSSTSATQPG